MRHWVAEEKPEQTAFAFGHFAEIVLRGVEKEAVVVAVAEWNSQLERHWEMADA